MTSTAKGTFEVKIDPVEEDYPPPGRRLLDKQFRGDLQATSLGQMLTALTAVPQSGGYVAVEQVTGTLHGRTGTFMLQHNGFMNRGEQSLTITVVPDSGTGELVGLAGEMTIHFEGEQHLYELTYTLADAL
jgi:hypothetical protein